MTTISDADPQQPRRPENAPSRVHWIVTGVLATALVLYVAYDQPGLRAVVGPGGVLLTELVRSHLGPVGRFLLHDVLGNFAAGVLVVATSCLAQRLRRAWGRRRGRTGAVQPPAE
ncbi:hypothetical protein [Streptomyces atratus]|uniref:hypothetical protein n=1 Tax=Streptomyces atratus TaxID=1893 RepID=UPI00364E9AF9